MWAALSMSRITCLPAREGHHFKDTQLTWVEGCLRCKHKLRDGSECGRLVYLVGGGLVTPRGSPLVLLASVTAAEMRQMADGKMDYERALEFLGIRFPG